MRQISRRSLGLSQSGGGSSWLNHFSHQQLHRRVSVQEQLSATLLIFYCFTAGNGGASCIFNTNKQTHNVLQFDAKPSEWGQHIYSFTVKATAAPLEGFLRLYLQPWEKSCTTRRSGWAVLSSCSDRSLPWCTCLPQQWPYTLSGEFFCPVFVQSHEKGISPAACQRSYLNNSFWHQRWYNHYVLWHSYSGGISEAEALLLPKKRASWLTLLALSRW